MENFQEKIREIIYQESFILYKKCLKVTLSKDKSNKEYLVKIFFDSDLAKNLIDINFLKNLTNKINNKLNLTDDNNIFKIIKFHFTNTKIKNIEGIYRITRVNKDIENLVNPIKMQVLRKFYHHIELDKLENNIFNFLDINTFIYYHKKYFKKFAKNLGYLLLIVYIFYLIDI